MVKGLPRGIGKRLYFSFSSAINAAPHRDSDSAREKLATRIRAVPDDKILIGEPITFSYSLLLAFLTRALADNLAEHMFGCAIE